MTFASAAPEVDAKADLATLPAFIERQLPVSRLSKETYKERKSNAGQTLTALGSYWKGRKPLILVRAVVLGLLLPATGNDAADRDVFLTLMMMDDEGLRRRKRPADISASRARSLLSVDLHAEAFEGEGRTLRWRRLPRERREVFEQIAFDAMDLDERLSHCLRPEEIPDNALDPVWPGVNAHLAPYLDHPVHSVPDLVEQLGRQRFGRRPVLGDPFSGGGSIPFEGARIGCDVRASDLNPLACLLTWGALNIVGGDADTRTRIAAAQAVVVQAVERRIVELGIEHDGGPEDVRLPFDAPSRWPHGWKVDRRGATVAPDAGPYEATCPRTGWRVPLIATRQVQKRSRTILRLVPVPAEQRYVLRAERGVSEAEWETAEAGTVRSQDGSFRLVHDTGAGEVRVRIANRAKAFLHCLETRCPSSGWMVPMAPGWLVSQNHRTVARLVPDPLRRRYSIDVVGNVSDEDMAAAKRGGTIANGTLQHRVDGREHSTSMERLRGEVRLKARYRDPAEKARDGTRLSTVRNRHAANAGNELRRWEKGDVAPRPDDVFQERLYAIQWVRPDGSLFFAAPTDEDLTREAFVEAMVRENLAAWQEAGLVPDTEIVPGEKTDEPIRTRGWTYWHHLFGPRHLLIGAMLRQEMAGRDDGPEAMGLALSFGPAVDRMSKLTHWRIGFAGGEGVAKAADAAEHVFQNQALNTFFNYGCRASWGLWRSLSPNYKSAPVTGVAKVITSPVASVESICDLWVTDPPYADAIVYDEITEYFLAWLSKNPPRRDWVWDSRRELAVRGETQAFKRGMIPAFQRLAERMPDNGFQVVMFTHQDVGVWAVLTEILWAAGLQVTAGWCILTETDKPHTEGSFVQGTVLLVLRKRLGDKPGFYSRLQKPVEDAARAQIESMRALDDRERPNFGDADYQLAAYAAALKVLTQCSTIEGRPVAAEVMRERLSGERSEIERLIERAVRIASDHLLPDGLPQRLWDDLSGEERFYLKGLDLERRGELRSGAFQELARGFGVSEYGALLARAKANQVRLKTAVELGRRDIKRAGTTDRAEDRTLEGFAGGMLRHVLYGVWQARQEEDLRPALVWFERNLPDYWSRQDKVAGLLDHLATIRTPDRREEAETAAHLAGAVRNHRP